MTPRDPPGGGYPVTVRFAGGPDGMGSDQLAASADAEHTFAVTATPGPSPSGGATGPSTGGTAPPHGSGDAAGRVTIMSGRVVVTHQRASIVLSCRGPRGAVCCGTRTLTIRIRQRSHGRRSRGRTLTVVVARGAFELCAGSSRSVALGLSGQGRARMARARRQGIAVTATAVLTDSRSPTARRRIVLDVAPTQSRRRRR